MMSWLNHHRRSESYAAEAELAVRSGDRLLADELYAKAAKAEVQALTELDTAKSRTLGISSVSAVSLYFKARNFEQAESVAYQWLNSRLLPDFASEQLRGLLQAIWSEQVRRKAHVEFARGQVMVSVSGGEIIEGGAPLDLIVEKVQTVQSLFYRTVEFLRNMPHRTRGGPILEIQEVCRPWLFQAPPGSYQFAVAVQEPRQSDLFKEDEPKPKEVTDQFLRILRTSVEDPESALSELVPDTDYRSTFLKLTRNLSPTGKTFGQLEVHSSDESRPITLFPSTRKSVSLAIRKSQQVTLESDKEEKRIHGVLRAVHLDKHWIELTVEGRNIRIGNVLEAVDDVIGPMVNKPVYVDVIRHRNGRYSFRDIEADD